MATGAKHSWPYSPLCFAVGVSLAFLFCHLILEIAWPIVTKLWHIIDGHPDLLMLRDVGQKFGPLP